jgi:threonine aldolase
MPIDLRSDTVTKPTPAMRAAMAQAEVGDDIVQEDPSVRALEERAAALLGLEAALYMPSGHMSNQVGLRAHSRPGDALICHQYSHILHNETGAPCALSGLSPRTVDTPDGSFTPEQIAHHILPINIHHSRGRILELENTHNRAGGSVWPLERFAKTAAFGKSKGLAVHLDGARLWNACIATSTKPADWAKHCDSVSVCFSKGLGAPVGSALCGSRDYIEEARFYRKMFGGQMRQAGIIAAGALYALEHHYERLAEDHQNARLLAAMLGEVQGLSVSEPQTNIVMADIAFPGLTAAELAQRLAPRVLCYAIAAQRIRLLTHLDVTRARCIEAAEIIAETVGGAKAAA